MKLLLPSLLIVVASGLSSAVAQTASPAPTALPAKEACADCTDCHGEEGETLRKLEVSWGEAVARHDADAVARIEADEFICTDPSGAVTHKAEDVASAKSHDIDLKTFEMEDVKTSIYGETAVVTGKTSFSGLAREQPFNGKYRWTDVFVKRDGRWQVVASQATNIDSSAGRTE